MESFYNFIFSRSRFWTFWTSSKMEVLPSLKSVVHLFIVENEAEDSFNFRFKPFTTKCFISTRICILWRYLVYFAWLQQSNNWIKLFEFNIMPYYNWYLNYELVFVPTNAIFVSRWEILERVTSTCDEWWVRRRWGAWLMSLWRWLAGCLSVSLENSVSVSPTRASAKDRKRGTSQFLNASSIQDTIFNTPSI